jgi:hypothetical protein
MEPPHRRRSHMGKKRKVKVEFLNFLAELSKSGGGFLLRGVGLSHPKNSKFERV